MKNQINSLDESKLLHINLQLFADGGADDDGDLELEEEQQEFDLEEDADEDEVGDLPDDDKPAEKPADKPADKPAEKPAAKEKTIPLSAFKKEQARLKAIINELKTGKPEKDSGKISKQALIDAGLDEATADTIVGVYGKSASTEKLVNSKFRDLEFKELKKEFPDIEENRDELEEYAESKGVTIEEAYLAKFGRAKLKANRADIEREVEQRLLEKFKKNGSMKFDTTDNGETTPKNKSGLTAEQKEAAKFLGMSEREYAIFSKGKSFDTFEKHTKKKG